MVAKTGAPLMPIPTPEVRVEPHPAARKRLAQRHPPRADPLASAACVLILFDAFAPKLRGATAPLAVIVFLAAGWSERLLVGGNFFGGTYQISAITIIFDYTFLLAAILATLFAARLPRSAKASSAASSTRC